MTILHVDKDESQESFKSDLKKQDVEYLYVETIFQAIGKLESFHVDIILVGEFLKGNTGLEFIKKLAETPYYSLPIVYITDNAFSSDKYFSLGVIDHIKRSELTTEKITQFLCYIIDQSLLVSEMRGLSVAIVDDSKVSHEIITSILEERGIVDITNFYDPVDLVNYKREFDVYFIDMVMPGITGDKLSSKIRIKSPQSIIIIMSSIDNVKTISNVLSGGADDYIIKPFNKDILLARLKTNYRSYKLVKKLDRVSKTDSLTGVYNHGYVFNKLHEEINNSKYKKSPLSIMLLDIDNFKSINDRFGHPVGDVVLKDLAGFFKAECRATDCFGRYGGEEFILIMPDTKLKDAKLFTDKIKKEFSERNIEGLDLNVTFSGGLVELSVGETGEEVIKRVDALMYTAKREGKDRIYN